MRVSRMMGVAASVVAVAALTGCEKPPPAITVWSGTHSVNTPALCWSFDAPQLQPGECAEEIVQGTVREGVPSLPVRPGNTVGISVDTQVAESGWTVIIGGQPLTETPLTETYYRVTLPYSLPDQPLPVQVVAGSNAQIRGVWIVNLQS